MKKGFGHWKNNQNTNPTHLFPTQIQIGKVILMNEEVQMEKHYTWVSV